jgi:hypothetical protein
MTSDLKVPAALAEFKHIVTSVEDFGLMIGFIGFFDTARDYHLQFTIRNTHTRIDVHSYIFTSRCSVAASNGGRFLSFGFPKFPQHVLPASHSNFSSYLTH